MADKNQIKQFTIELYKHFDSIKKEIERDKKNLTKKEKKLADELNTKINIIELMKEDIISERDRHLKDIDFKEYKNKMDDIITIIRLNERKINLVEISPFFKIYVQRYHGKFSLTGRKKIEGVRFIENKELRDLEVRIDGKEIWQIL